MTSAKLPWVIAQSLIWDKIRVSEYPFSVSEYSTLCLASFFSMRFIRFADRRSLNCCDNIFRLMPLILRLNSKKCVSCSSRQCRICGLYFPPSMRSVSATGHIPVSEISHELVWSSKFVKISPVTKKYLIESFQLKHFMFACN